MKDKIATQWILIRGLARESRHWGEFPELLLKSLNAAGNGASEKHAVDCIDLPGTGGYSEMSSPLSIAETAEFVRSKYFELRNRQRESGIEPAAQAYLVAISLGGMVASEWLAHWPSDFSGCVLINTSFKGFSPINKRLQPSSLMRFAKILAHRDPVAREREVLAMVSNQPSLYEHVAQQWAKIALSRPIRVENFARQLVAAARFQAEQSAPPVRVLILNSLKDRMVHPSCSKEIALKWHAELHRHLTAGHDLPLDASAWTVDEIVRWWKSLARNQVTREGA